MSDIGAIESGRWHASHFSRKIGAISLENVGVFGASAAAAAPGTSSAAPNTHCVSCLMFVLPLAIFFTILWPDGHFYVGVGPAALEATTALTRFVVRLHAQHIVARRGKSRVGGNHIALLHHRHARLVEGHLPGTAEQVQPDAGHQAGPAPPG